MIDLDKIEKAIELMDMYEEKISNKEESLEISTPINCLEDVNVCEIIDAILILNKLIEKGLNFYKKQLSYEDFLRQDLLHDIELGSTKKETPLEILKLLRLSSKRRRIAKDNIDMLSIVKKITDKVLTTHNMNIINGIKISLNELKNSNKARTYLHKIRHLPVIDK